MNKNIIFIALLIIDIMLIYLFFALNRIADKRKVNIKPLVFVLLGMFIGLLSGFIVFFNVDKVKGWDPYGWWFLATFLSTVCGGVISVFFISDSKKRRKDQYAMYNNKPEPK